MSQPTIVRTSACSTTYLVPETNTLIELWIITGGTPALGIVDSTFSQRYPELEKFKNENYVHGRSDNFGHYKHQDPLNPKGPTPDEVLPEGWQTFNNFYNTTYPSYKLSKDRVEKLPVKFPVISKRIHDKENRTYVKAFLGQCFYNIHNIPCVTLESATYCGRWEEKMYLFNDWWKQTAILFNKISSRRWCDITDEQYNAICDHLALIH